MVTLKELPTRAYDLHHCTFFVRAHDELISKYSSIKWSLNLKQTSTAAESPSQGLSKLILFDKVNASVSAEEFLKRLFCLFAMTCEYPGGILLGFVKGLSVSPHYVIALLFDICTLSLSP